MKKAVEIIGKKRVVKLVTGLNYYSKKQTIPVLGKLPSRKIEEGRRLSDWGLDLNLRKATITTISVERFDMNDYDCIMIDGVMKEKGIDY